MNTQHLTAFNQEISLVAGGAGSTDVGNVSQVIPTLHPHIKISEYSIPAHSIEFREAARSELGLQSISLGAQLLAFTALDLLLDHDLLDKIKAQHKAEVAKQYG